MEIPLSVRHDLFLNTESKLAINASFFLDFSLGFTIEFTRADNSILNLLDVNPGTHLAVGFGYKFDDKYGIEMRHQFGKEPLSNYYL